MRFVSARSNNAEAQNFREHLSWFAGAVHAMVRELIGGQALSVERSEAGLVAKKRTAGHGHAAREENFDRGIEPEHRSTRSAKKFRAARLGVGAAAEGDHRAFLVLGHAAQGSAELIGFQLAEGRLTEAFEYFGDSEAGGFFDAIVEIDETPGELASEERANSGLAGTMNPARHKIGTRACGPRGEGVVTT